MESYRKYLILKTIGRNNDARQALEWALFINPYNQTLTEALENEPSNYYIKEQLKSFKNNNFYILSELMIVL